ncbi:MAG: hypothetical protein DSZ35_10485 [Verrucomicrobia bacterium]|nr:MAG: hypothetical protein DSZ35_10485 [Verrucomicrobiota bacterium]
MKAWTEITLWKRVMAGLVLGLAIGLIMRYGLGAETASSIGETWFKPFGDGFVRLIKMLVVPLIFTTLFAGVPLISRSSASTPLTGMLNSTSTVSSDFTVNPAGGLVRLTCGGLSSACEYFQRLPLPVSWNVLGVCAWSVMP